MKNTMLLVSGLLAVSAGNNTMAQNKPNIIFIYADDLGYGDLGCYGSKVNRTPNLDQLAKEGMRFTDFYSAASLSSPSRAALLTGRYPVRMGINGVFFPGSFTGIPKEEITLGEALQQQGYYTGIVGKWHLGHHLPHCPLQNGFNEYFGIPYSNDMAPCLYMRGNTAESRVVNQDSITINYTNEAIQFIEKNKNSTFFLYLAHSMPHVPLGASPNFKGRSSNGLYGDVIEELDWSVGEIIKKLEELRIDENTIIIFSSDNGPWIAQGPLGGVATPFFQGKASNWEGGFKVPAIIRWKDHIPEEQESHELAAMTDWFPTLVKLSGGEIPNDRIIDGKSLLPVLFNKGKRENQDFAYIEYGNLTGFRSGDWKILLPEEFRKGNFWVEDVPAHDTVLFNLKNDIAERTDVKNKYPEIFNQLKNKLNSFKETLRDCPPSLFLMEWQTDNTAWKQREESIRNARKKGIQPKSP